jgi:hypothetical protein
MQVAEPKGWEEAAFNLERDVTHDVLTEYSSQLGFYGASRDFIADIMNLYGVDTALNLQLFMAPGPRDPLVFEEEWEVNLESYELAEDPDIGDMIFLNVQATGFQVPFFERIDTKINFDDANNLDGGTLPIYPPNVVTMHSYNIDKSFEGRFEIDSLFHGGLIVTTPETRFLSITIGWPVVTDEINDFFTLGSGFLSEQQRVNFFEAKEAGTFDVDINIDATLKINRDIGDFDRVKWQWIFQKNDEPQTILAERTDNGVSQYEEDLAATHTAIIPINLGDRLYVYGNVEITDITGNLLGFYQFSPFIKFKAGTFMTVSGSTSIPSNQVNCQLIHNSFAKACDSITGVNNSFYSEYLGLTSLGYASDGEFGFFALTSGANLRNLVDRDMVVSFKQLFDSLNAITPIGAGLDVIDGRTVIRIEHITHFYDSSSVLTFDNISGMKTTIATEVYFKTIEIGYSKGLPEDIGGLLEPNVKKEYATILKRTGVKGSFVSDFVASGSLIEQQRREAADSKDARFDKDIFIVALNRSNIALAERDENYTVVNNRPHADTAYNLRLSPAMNLLRQGPVINGGLIKKIGSKYKLLTNDGNFAMQTTASHDDSGNFNKQLLDESADIPWNYEEDLHGGVVPLYKDLFSDNILDPVIWNDTDVNDILAEQGGLLKITLDDNTHNLNTLSTTGIRTFPPFYLGKVVAQIDVKMTDYAGTGDASFIFFNINRDNESSIGVNDAQVLIGRTAGFNNDQGFRCQVHASNVLQEDFNDDPKADLSQWQTVKIVVETNNDIKFYKWANNQWTQIGSTVNHNIRLSMDLRTVIKYKRINGADESNTFHLRNWYISDEDYASQYPDVGLISVVKPLFKPFLFEFTHPLSFRDFKILKTPAGRKMAITFSTDGVNFKKGYIKTLEYNQVSAVGTFTLIEANDVPADIIDTDIGYLIYNDTGYLLLNEGGRLIVN